ncbi:MAG: OmpA family protein [Azoarcus sp.]|jgi:outer membrane protein OmpA-like peptidoglycan-associated protein|nr:OmpA family protein [Azoarcus sp.]
MTKFLAAACRAVSAGKWILLLNLGLLSVGCQTPQPPPKAAGLSEEQVAVLRELGFETDDAGWRLDFGAPFLFESDTSRLSGQSRESIARMVNALKVMGVDRLRVEGYADNRGSKLYNEQLSLRRAEAVAREIERNGMPYSNIVVTGFGTDNPVGDNKTRKGRAQNRRVAVIVPVMD